MIWHVLEVWALLAVAFIIGCVGGALCYGAIGRSRLATAQGVLADSVGDVIDSIKARIGMAPAWRPGRLRNVERPAPPRRAEAGLGGDGQNDGYPDFAADVRVEPTFASPTVARETGVGTGDALAEIADETARDVPASAAGVAASGEPSRAAQAMQIAADGIEPKRPPGLSGPRGGAPDNLQRIKGIGRRNEAALNSLGIYHFSQIAAWTPAEIRWIGQYLAFPERVERDDWPGQATQLAMGEETGFEKSADRRRRRRRQQREFAERMATALTDAEPTSADEDPFEDVFEEPIAMGADRAEDDGEDEPQPEGR